MLEKLKAWLTKPADTVVDKIMFGAGAFLLNMVWLFVVIAGLTFLDESRWNGHPEYWAFFFGCVFAPLWEELAFRVIPIQIARGFGDKFLIPVIFLSSLIFGWGHGNGPVSLLIQGVGGLILACTYVKTKYNYWVVVAMHSAWNIWQLFFFN